MLRGEKAQNMMQMTPFCTTAIKLSSYVYRKHTKVLKTDILGEQHQDRSGFMFHVPLTLDLLTMSMLLLKLKNQKNWISTCKKLRLDPYSTKINSI